MRSGMGRSPGHPKNKIPSPIKYIFPKPNDYGRSHLVGTLSLGILLLVSALNAGYITQVGELPG
ncbi:MAG: hypothetical protein RM338_28055 [Nostoc sp. DedQUE12a]|nr:hypothetical protein [Nostoc sp. DedQUE12a]